uniref:Enhancer of polycomb-like protein n=1 Tax=Heterorhabditis bacteriophora TaxID=37862 RepID=A0A1I7XF31_HETBA
MARVEASPYAVTKICFPTLALQKTTRGHHVTRKLSSENHRDYLYLLHSRKAATIKEKRAKAERKRQEDELKEGITKVTVSKQNAIFSKVRSKMRWRSFDFPDKVTSHIRQTSLSTSDIRQSFIQLTFANRLSHTSHYQTPSTSSKEELTTYHEINSYSTPDDSPSYLCSYLARSNINGKVDKNSLRIGRGSQMCIKDFEWSKRFSASSSRMCNARPKAKPLQDYYNDDDAELEAMAKMTDPSAPRPEGHLMAPVRGENAGSSSQTLLRSVDSALHRFGTTSPKNVVGMVLDQSGRPTQQLTYGMYAYSLIIHSLDLCLFKSIISKCIYYYYLFRLLVYYAKYAIK